MTNGDGNGHEGSAKEALEGLTRLSMDVRGDLFHDRRTEGRRTAPGYRYRSDSPTASAEPVSYGGGAMGQKKASSFGKPGGHSFGPFTSAADYDESEGGHPFQPWYPPRYS